MTILLLLNSALFAGERFPIISADSGSVEVDKLVVQLVSTRPAPLPIGRKMPKEWRNKTMFMGRYMTDDVRSAIVKLSKMGPSVFPFLMKHMEDSRYSYSSILPSAPMDEGWMNWPVSSAIDLVITNDLNWSGGYKSRTGANGEGHTPPRFFDYVESQGGMDKWVRKVMTKSRKEVDLAFIDWCIEKEKIWGFEDKESEDFILGRYAEKRKNIEQAAADQPLTTP